MAGAALFGGTACTPDRSAESRRVKASAVSVDPTQPLTDREKDVLHEAEQLLIQACMSERGFRTWVVPRVPLPEDRDFPYVVDDVRWAGDHGYGSELQKRRDQVRSSDPNRRYFERLSPQEQELAVDALHGRRSARRLEVTAPNGMTVARFADGCTARAQEELYGDLRAWFRAGTITDALGDMNRARVFTEKEFKDSTRDWSACMRGRGFPYATPHDSRRAFRKPADTASRKKEIRTAVAEAECAVSSGLSATAHRLEQRIGAHLTDEYADEFRNRLRLERAALKRARSTVENG
ncbi:hypothetical protein ABZV14_24850 [Streptosporangium canum]|uniref:hypothetical protein n=1 Tax=Streptosporangium canum TaxID=324952 RepID=UPI0033B89B1A